MIKLDNFGAGTTVNLADGRTMFQLHSGDFNPIIIPKDLNVTSIADGKIDHGAVFNPGACIKDGKIILTPRVHHNYRQNNIVFKIIPIKRLRFKNYISRIWPLVSDDGITFARLGDSELKGEGFEHQDFSHGLEDIRIIKYQERFILVGTGKINPPFRGNGNDDRIAIYSTQDFNEFVYHGVPLHVQSRNTIPFIDEKSGDVYMLMRFPPEKHIYICKLEVGIDQLLNPHKYKNEWYQMYLNRSTKILLKGGMYEHEQEKIGAGPPPIRTDQGWLLIYRGVGSINRGISRHYGLETGLKRSYNICAALLDKDEPNKILKRSPLPIYIPSKPYELDGNAAFPVDVPAIVFPNGVINLDGKLLVYCGSGDKYTILLTCNTQHLIQYLLEFG